VALDGDHFHEGLRRADVAVLDEALAHVAGGGVERPLVRGGQEVLIALVGDRCPAGRGLEPQGAEDRTLTVEAPEAVRLGRRAHDATPVDLDAGDAVRHDDRPVAAEDRVPVLVHQFAGRVQLQGSGARPALAGRRPDHHEPLAAERDVEWVAGGAQCPGAEVGGGLGDRRRAVLEARERALGLEAVGRDVREVVRHDLLATLPVPERGLRGAHAIGRNRRGNHGLGKRGGRLYAEATGVPRVNCA